MHPFRNTIQPAPLCIIAVLVLSVVAMFPVWSHLFSIATQDEEASHLLLVPFVFGWLLWCSRSTILSSPVTHRMWGLLVIAGAVVLQEIGLQHSAQVLWHVSAVLCLIGACWLIFGATALRNAWPTFAVLLFVVPVPGLLRQQISLPIQQYSAAITQWLLSLAGTEVQRSGCVLIVEGTAVTVAEACTGMRMLFAVLLVVYVMAFSLTSERKTQAMLLILSPLFAMLMNVVRLSISAWMFGACSESVAVFWHDINGWLIPGSLMLAVILFTETAAIEVTSTTVNASFWRFAPTAVESGLAVVVFVAAFTINMGRLPHGHQTERHRARVSAQLVSFPFSVGDWLGVPEQMHAEEIRLLRPLTGFRREYANVNSRERLSVFAVLTADARDLVGHEPGICLSGQGWQVQNQRAVSWRCGSIAIHGRDYCFQSGRHDERRQVTSILLVAGGESSGDMQTVAEAAADFRRAPYGACAVQISSSEMHTDAEWQHITEQFVNHMQPLVRSFTQCTSQRPPLQLAAVKEFIQ